MKNKLRRLTALMLAMAMSFSLLSANACAWELFVQDDSTSVQSLEKQTDGSEISVNEEVPNEEDSFRGEESHVNEEYSSVVDSSTGTDSSADEDHATTEEGSIIGAEGYTDDEVVSAGEDTGGEMSVVEEEYETALADKAQEKEADDSDDTPPQDEQNLQSNDDNLGEEVTVLSLDDIPQDGTRYTVLIIDQSGSMNGTPLRVAKEAAKKFCTSLLSLDKKSYVSIIVYSSSSSTICDFTNDISIIESKINSISYGNGGTNTNDALTCASNLINNVPENRIRNVVLLSDGLPESGKTETLGHYSPNDGSGYAYANAAYITASRIKETTNIYTLGFFHALGGSDLKFGRKVMTDIASNESMYYEVVDIGDLEFVFGDIADNISQSALERIYIDQHLEYIRNGQYQIDIQAGFGNNMEQVLNDVSDDSTVRNYNFCSALSKTLNYKINLTEEYELLLAELMVNDQTYHGIEESFITSFQSTMNNIIEITMDSLDSFIVASNISDRKKLVELADNMLNETFLSDKYCEIYQEYSALVNKNLSAFKAREILGKLGFVAEVADVTLSTASETFEYACYGQAYKEVSDDFIFTLILLDYQASTHAWNNDAQELGPAKQLFEMAELQLAIEEFINNMEDYKQDNVKAVASYAGKQLSQKTVSTVSSEATDLLLGALPVFQAIPLFKIGLDAGLSITEIFTDIDNRAASGNMIEKLYVISTLLYYSSKQAKDVLIQDVDNEESVDKQFRSAALFDETISLYKTAVILASDYGIEYERICLNDESERTFPSRKRMSWDSIAISLAAVEKLRANNIQCHHAGLSYDHKSNIVFDEKKLKVFTIACPVDVYVTDANGTQIAHLSDNNPSVLSDYTPYFYTVSNSNSECIKVVVLPENTDFSVMIRGIGNGKMDAVVGLYNGTKLEKCKAYTDIQVEAGDTGYFMTESDSSDIDVLVFDDVTYDLDTSEKDYAIMNVNGSEKTKIITDKEQYHCAADHSVIVTATIDTTQNYVKGSRRYIGYLAYLKNWQWIQIASWYIDGGSTVYQLPISIGGELTGNKLFTVSIFDSDNFVAGGSLYDCFFHINCLSENFTISFDPAGGECGTTSKQVSYAELYGNLPTPTLKGHIFGGWYTDLNHTSARVTENSTVSITHDHTLYASWIKQQFLVRFDPNGGKCDRKTQLYYFGDKYGELPVPMLENKTFLGWFTSNNGGSLIQPGMEASRCVLYAHWSDTPLTCNHNWNNGTITTPPSCTQTGAVTYFCSKCGTTMNDELPVNLENHVGGTEIRNRKAATCGTDGYTGDTYCLSCGEKLSGGQITRATGGHTWDSGTVTTQPTTTTEGVKTYKCTVCGQTRTESVAKLSQPEPVVKVANTIKGKDLIFRTYNAKKDQSFTLGVSANGAPLSYQSSNKKVMVKNGKVTVKKGFMGQVTITVTASETAKYKKAQKKITLMVGPSATKLSSVKYDAKKKVINAAWKKNTTCKGYEIQVSLKKDFKKVAKKVKINKNATVKTAIKGLKKGTYYVRIRTINGKAYSDWSKTKTVKITK